MRDAVEIVRCVVELVSDVVKIIRAVIGLVIVDVIADV